MTDANPTTGFRALVSDAYGPVTCAACGCRLQGVGPEGAQAYFHFGGSNGRDARGCRVECAELVHDARGRAQAAVVAA
jgi:hypothetical protein